MSERGNRADRRRWLRFSLRTLLIVVTVLCVLLGTWITRARRVDYAVAHFGRLGGYFGYPSGQLSHGRFAVAPRGPIWLRRNLCDHLFDSPVLLEFGSNSLLTDADLRPLAMLPSLELLFINGGRVAITDEGWAALQGLPRLKLLMVGQVDPVPTDAMLKYVGSLTNLESLQVVPSKFSAAGIARLNALENLHSLHVGNVTDLDAALEYLKSLPKLESFSSDALRIDVDPERPACELSAGTFAKLKYLRIAGPLSDAGYRQLLLMPQLEDLTLIWDQAPDEALSIVAKIPRLRVLQFRSDRATDSGLSALGEARGLQRLSLQMKQVDGSGMRTWSDLTQLKKLYFQSTPIVDESLHYVDQLPALGELVLEGARVTRSAVWQLRAQRPLVSIVAPP